MVADSTTDQVTVSWRTGPSATDAPYTVTCFTPPLGNPLTCRNYAEAGGIPVATASGDLEKSLLPYTVEETLTFAGVAGDVAQCFIDVEGPFGLAGKCMDLEAIFEDSAGNGRSTEDPDRLVAHITKPSVVADPATNSFEVSWSTLGAVTDGLYEVACYQLIDGADPITCKDLPENPDFSAVGEYDKALMKESYAVEFSDLETFDGVTFQCFIAVEGEYGLEKCKEAGEAVFPALPNGAPERSATEDPDRLVAHITKPSVEYDDAADSVTVAWSTGPTVTEGSATVSCYSVLLGAEPITCKNLDEATPFGTDNVVYDKTLMKETYESTISLPLDISSAQCFIEVEGEYGLEKCKEAGEVDIPQTLSPSRG